jgi:hypothetical protein
MKKLSLAIILLITLLSCNTVRQTQLQPGTVTITKGHIYFEPSKDWKNIPSDTTFQSFRVKNTAVKKSK